MKKLVLVGLAVVGALAVPVGAASAHAPGHGGDTDAPPGMHRMHEQMHRGNPGMQRMHELMQDGNAGMQRMHALMSTDMSGHC